MAPKEYMWGEQLTLALLPQVRLSWLGRAKWLPSNLRGLFRTLLGWEQRSSALHGSRLL